MYFYFNNIYFLVDNQVKAGKLGAIEVILDVMRKHEDSVDLCYNGCYALGCIVLNNGKTGSIIFNCYIC